MDSLLTKVTKNDVVAEPFPHIVVPDAIDESLCDRLQAEFPPLEMIAKMSDLPSNKRFGLTASEVAGNEEISPTWREFVQLHSSQRFLDELLALFGDHVRALYPELVPADGNLDSLQSGIRHVDSFEDHDVLMDAQISVNTPVIGPPDSVRMAHVDNKDKLFGGLFYLRSADDDSTGGDLDLYRFKSSPRGFRGEAPYHTFLETAKTVPYKRNMLVIFLNSPTAVHGVTVRSQTDVARYFLNLIATVEKPLFDLEPLQASWKDRAVAGPEILSNRIRKLPVGAK